MNTSLVDDPIKLLSDLNDSDGADLTFQTVLNRIDAATQSIVIHMFVWRNDDIGNAIGERILQAAQRGVRILIKKDIGAFMYERIEMNKKSFFNKQVSVFTRVAYRIRGWTFPDTYVEDDYNFDLGQKVMQHDNVTIEWVNHTHTKYYIFDNSVMVLGSINIEDRHRKYRDYMVEISGSDYITRFQNRNSNAVPCDPERSLDFVVNRMIDGKRQFEIKEKILGMLSNAKSSITIEMAYIGDPEITKKIIEKAHQDVQVTMLFSREANIGNDLNYKALHSIFQAAGIDVYLSEKMIHSKMMLFDEETVILGSANISVFSMQKAVELVIVIRENPGFMKAIRQTVSRRIGESKKVHSIHELEKFNKVIALGQQIYQFLH